MKPNELHRLALKIAHEYKRCEVDLIDILEKVDRQKVFYHYKCNSLFSYAISHLGLSPEVASIFITVARKTREIPKLKEEIKNGTITVSKARRMSAVINFENQDHWLEIAKSSSKANLEKEIALAKPELAVRERLDYVHPNLEIKEKVVIGQLRVQLQAGISEKLMLKIRRAQDVLSSQKRKSGSLEETLEAAIDLYLAKEDPLAKANRQKMRGKLPGQHGLGTTNVDDALSAGIPLADWRSAEKTEPAVNPTLKYRPVPERERAHPSLRIAERQPLSAQTRHKINLKYKGQCAHLDDKGLQCQQRRHLEIHHRHPVSKGGSNSSENLILYCSGHHRSIHLQTPTRF